MFTIHYIGWTKGAIWDIVCLCVCVWGGDATGKAGNGKRERETKICAKLPGQRQLVALRTHGSLTLFMSRTRKNCGEEGTTINSIIVRVIYIPFSSHLNIVRIVHCMQLKIY